jgi:hypothetical protein
LWGYLIAGGILGLVLLVAYVGHCLASEYGEDREP